MVERSSKTLMIRQAIGTALGLSIYAVLFLLLANSPAVQQPTRDNSAESQLSSRVNPRLQHSSLIETNHGLKRNQSNQRQT